MKADSVKIKELEASIKAQSKIIDQLNRRISIIEKENVRRKRDIEELKRNVK